MQTQGDMQTSWVTEHLIARGVCNFNGVLVAPEYAYFMLYNPTGQLIGYQRYKPNGVKGTDMTSKTPVADRKYYLWFNEELFAKGKKSSLWGWQHYNKDEKVVFLVEGVFDAMKVLNAGYNVFATLGNDPVLLKEQLMLLRQTHTVVVVADNDDAGRKLLKYGHKGVVVSESKDLGEMEQEQVSSFLKTLV